MSYLNFVMMDEMIKATLEELLHSDDEGEVKEQE